MNVKEMIKMLEKIEPNAEVFVSSDEELNTIYEKFRVDYLGNKKQIVIYGLSGCEVED